MYALFCHSSDLFLTSLIESPIHLAQLPDKVTDIAYNNRP